MTSHLDADDATLRSTFGFAFTDCPQRALGTDASAARNVVYELPHILHASGARLRLTQLMQQGSYLGQLCGLPSTRDIHLEWETDTATRHFPHSEGRLGLLPPELLLGCERRSRPDGQEQEARWRGLPPVFSVAEFDFPGERTDPFCFYSLYIAWWQSSFGLPDERAREQIAALTLAPIAFGWDP